MRRRLAVAIACLVVVACTRDEATTLEGPSLSINASSFLLALRASAQLTVSASSLPDTLAWTSSDEHVLTVSSTGLVTGVALGGPVTVTVRGGDLSASAHITVTPARIDIRGVPDSVSVGATVQLSAVAFDAAGAIIDAGAISWNVEPAGIVSMSAAGVMTGIAPGIVDVVASAGGRADRATSGVPSVYDGTWLGTATGARPVQVNVRFGTLSLFNVDVLIVACTTIHAGTNLPVRIMDDRITVGVGGASVSAAFASATSMTGDFGTMQFTSITCDDGTRLIQPQFYGPGTFTAAKQ